MPEDYAVTKITSNKPVDSDTAVGFILTENVLKIRQIKLASRGVILYLMNIMLPMMKMDQMIGNDLQNSRFI